jgi:undecaprenyl-diphosphatase
MLAADIESFNTYFFHILNASATPSATVLWVARFSAEWLIYLVAVMMVVIGVVTGRKVRLALLQVAATIVIALIINFTIAAFWYHPRPFELGLGNQFSPHAIETSFPSDHGTVLFAVAFATLIVRSSRGVTTLAFGIAILVAWARIYLGVHWPLDMIGSLIVAAVACLIVKLVWRGRAIEVTQCWLLDGVDTVADALHVSERIMPRSRKSG